MPRNIAFWSENFWNNFSDDRFKQTSRLSSSTFTFLLSHILHKLVNEYIAEEPIPLEIVLESAYTVSLERITCILWQKWLDLQNHSVKNSHRGVQGNC